MENFNFSLSTRFHFGEKIVEELPKEILKYGKNVFFLFDEIPAKSTGAYELIHSVCSKNGIKVIDFTGIEPNPKHSTIDKATELLKQEQADCIVALGGGSTIDSGKAISFSYYHEGSCWDFFEHKAEVEKCLPLITIPTIAASGAEVSNVTVVSNHDLNKKLNYRSDQLRPVAVFSDPTYTYSVPTFQTACGIVDIMSHSYEGYFSHYEGSIQDGFSETIQKTCIDQGRKVMICPHDYDARAELLWAAELSITHLADQGRNFIGCIHAMEQALSGYFGLPHGAGIAIMSLAWFKYSLNDTTVARYARWGRNVWNIQNEQNEYETARKAFKTFENFLTELNLPTRLSELRNPVDPELFPQIAHDLFLNADVKNWFKPIDKETDLIDLLNLAYK